MWPDALIETAQELLVTLKGAQQTLITAESCTGGLVTALLTSLAGSSEVIEGGFCTYSNAQKSRALGVRNELLDRYGAVSAETAAAMANGAIDHSSADISVSLTGIAGPGGDTEEKPIGLVYIATTLKGECALARRYVFDGDRTSIRLQSVEQALLDILNRISNVTPGAV